MAIQRVIIAASLSRKQKEEELILKFSRAAPILSVMFCYRERRHNCNDMLKKKKGALIKGAQPATKYTTEAQPTRVGPPLHSHA